MIQVDRRIGSRHLSLPLRLAGIKVHQTTLSYGDAAFVGRGPACRPITVGIELKRFPDLLSSITSKRLVGHQLPGLLSLYDQVWLIVEGDYQPQRDGSILYRGGSYRLPVRLSSSLSYDGLNKFLITLQLKTGIRVYRSLSPADTLYFLTSLYRWWTLKSWDDHHAHLGVHQKNLPVDNMFDLPNGDRHLRDVASALPWVGYKRMRKAVSTFPSILSMITAPAEDWVSVCGKLTAEKLYQEIRRDVRKRVGTVGTVRSNGQGPGRGRVLLRRLRHRLSR